MSVKYSVLAFLTALLLTLLFRKYGLSFELFVGMVFVSLLAAISLNDLDFKTIPDALSIGGIIVGLVAAYFRTPFFFFRDALYGIVLGGGVLCAIAFVYRLFAGRQGMGGGDIKLLAMIGSFCGPKGVMFSLIAGSFMGSFVGIPLMFLKGGGREICYSLWTFVIHGCINLSISGR